MTFHFLLLLLSFCFLLCLAWLWHLDWAHHGLPHLAAKTAHPMVHRLLKPHTPLDCPACRLDSTASSGGGLAPVPVRPWREVKSRRGAPKRVNTEGYACPNQQCAYCGITDAHIHALVGDGKHGRAERIQTFRCQACLTTFTARRHTPLYHLKTPSYHVAMVLSAIAEGLDPSAAERVFGYRQATITTWLSRAGEHAQTLHQHSHLATSSSRMCSWMNCEHGCAAVPRCSGCGWPSTPAPSFCPCSISAPARNTRRIGSSTPCDCSWLLAASRSSPVMASISTFMLSRLTLDSGSKWYVEGATCAGGRWSQA